MVTWPAVIKYYGEDELIYVESFVEWQADPGLCHSSFQSEDRLIDSNGALFTLPKHGSASDIDAFIWLKTAILVKDFVELVRKHAVVENYCCAAKLNAKTHRQVIMMVKEINSI